MAKLNIPKETLSRLYLGQKLTTYDIADKFGCCQATIWKRLHEYKIKPRSPWNAVDLTKGKLANWYLKQRLSTWEIEKRYGYTRSTVHRKLKEYGIPLRDSSTAHIIFPRQDFKGSTQNKAYLIGFRIGDLRVRRHGDTIHADCGSTKQEQINLIKGLFEEYGNVWIGKANKRGAVQIEASLNLSFKFLLSKEAPPWIFKSDEHFFAFLAGFTDAEGCVSISKGMAYYSLGNYDLKLLTQIRNYLVKKGIQCSCLAESKTRGRLCFGKYFHKQNYFNLSIHQKKALIAFFNLLIPYIKHNDKISAIKMARENIDLRNRAFGNINM